ncbi:hypothetical protein Hanom_Chr01g00019891 [Helianthus anomalus]
MKEKDAVPESMHGRSASAEVIKDVTAMDHYALYAGNDWEGAWNMQKKKRKFNFNEARKAVEEANENVLQYAMLLNVIKFRGK